MKGTLVENNQIVRSFNRETAVHSYRNNKQAIQKIDFQTWAMRCTESAGF